MDDYTGVPLFQLRQFLMTTADSKSKLWFAQQTGINPMELSRIFVKARGTAILGLNKVDKIVSALGYNLGGISPAELTVVPMGSGLQNCRLMAQDECAVNETPATEAFIEQRARQLRFYRRLLLSNTRSQEDRVFTTTEGKE